MKNEPKGKKDSGKNKKKYLENKAKKKKVLAEDEIIIVLGKPVYVSNL